MSVEWVDKLNVFGLELERASIRKTFGRPENRLVLRPDPTPVAPDGKDGDGKDAATRTGAAKDATVKDGTRNGGNKSDARDGRSPDEERKPA